MKRRKFKEDVLEEGIKEVIKYCESNTSWKPEFDDFLDKGAQKAYRIVESKLKKLLQGI